MFKVWRRMIMLFLTFVLFSLLWSGCVPQSRIREDRAREEISPPSTITRDYENALDAYKRDEWEIASQRFQAFITHYPHSSLTDDALYYTGEIYIKQANYAAAIIQFETLIRQFPSSSKYQDTQWSMANSYFKMGDYHEALKIARQLLPAVEHLSLWRGRLFTFFGDCHDAMNDPIASLSWYARVMRELLPTEREKVRERIITLIDKNLPLDTYREFEIIHRGTFIAAYARYRHAQLLYRERNFKEAADVLRVALNEASGEDFYHLIEDLWVKIQRGGKEEVVLGCILPLQGKAKAFGIKALHGIELSIGAFQSDRWPFKIRLVIWDSQGDPARDQEGVRVLVKKGAVAIIGPLLSQTAEAAAEEAEVQKIPLITLSPLMGIAKKGKYIFQNSLTHASQVKTLAHYSFKEFGITTYAILYPRNSYGLTFKKLFQQEVEDRGGKVVVAASYTDEQTDFGDVIKGIAKYQSSKDPKKKSRPIINFKAIFIPDDAKRINLLVPQLAYYNITGVKLLGTNGWNSPELVSDSGDFFEGAIFVDGFFKDSPLPWVRDFAMHFEETFNLSPTLLESLCYDATEVILKTISSKGRVSCEDLLSLQGYNGVSGFKGFNSEGEGIRDVFVLTVSKEKIYQISPVK